MGNYIITESYSTSDKQLGTLCLGATYVIHGPPGKNMLQHLTSLERPSKYYSDSKTVQMIPVSTKELQTTFSWYPDIS